MAKVFLENAERLNACWKNEHLIGSNVVLEGMGEGVGENAATSDLIGPLNVLQTVSDNQRIEAKFTR